MSRKAIGSLVCAMAADAVPTNSAVMSKPRMVCPPIVAFIVAPSSRVRGEGYSEFQHDGLGEGQAAPPHPTVFVEQSVLPSPRKRGEGALATALVSHAFGLQPLLDQVGDLIAVLVHHHHVGV